MAVVFHLKRLVIGAARVVHHHDKRAIERSAHRFPVKLLRRECHRFAHCLAILVGEGIGKLFYRLTQREAEHVIDGAEHLAFTCLDGIGLLLVCHHIAQFQPKLTQLAGNEARGTAGVFGGIGLQLRTLGCKTVFLSKVGDTAEGATIANGRTEKELHPLVVNGFIGTVYHTLQHEVGLFQLVIKEEVVV